MSAKKKASKKRPNTKTSAGNRTRSKKKGSAGKRPGAQKQLSKKKAPQKKARKKSTRTPKVSVRSRDRAAGGVLSQRGQQSGDLEGLSRRPRADSESVEELLEEGNAFEAGAVSGVEHADDFEEQEVHTHEVPEDDVPEEYLDKDS